MEAAELEAVTAKSETGSTTTYEPDTTIEEEMYPAKRNRNCGSHKMKCRTLSKFWKESSNLELTATEDAADFIIKKQ